MPFVHHPYFSPNDGTWPQVTEDPADAVAGDRWVLRRIKDTAATKVKPIGLLLALTAPSVGAEYAYFVSYKTNEGTIVREEFTALPDNYTTVITVTTDLTVGRDDSTVLADASGGAITLTLKSIASFKGKRYSIKKIDSSANAVTIAFAGSETADGQTTLTLSSQYDSVTLAAGPSEWSIV